LKAPVATPALRRKLRALASRCCAAEAIHAFSAGRAGAPSRVLLTADEELLCGAVERRLNTDRPCGALSRKIDIGDGDEESRNGNIAECHSLYHCGHGETAPSWGLFSSLTWAASVTPRRLHFLRTSTRGKGDATLSSRRPFLKASIDIR
jgi:hypothetical protein